MTKYKVYRVTRYGRVEVEIAQAFDWLSLINTVQYAGEPIFKIEVYSSSDPIKGE